MRILHVFRTPVGGLFRHARDLVRGQSAMGHACGIVCDASTGGPAAEAALESVRRCCALGIERLTMARVPGFADIRQTAAVTAIARRAQAAILHGHGAKGGLYARMAGRRLGIPSVYTPHGGSLHFSWISPPGAAFLAAERGLRRIGAGLLFVCNFEREAFDAKIGLGGKPHRVVHNGLWPEDFEAVAPAADARDLVYVGELRKLKGTDVLIAALARLNRDAKVTATIAGDGEDRAAFERQAQALGLADAVRFTGAVPARKAFALGRVFVMPSRAESFPYALLEALAAGLPVVASRVGGIPEVLPSAWMVEPGNADALAAAISATLTGRRDGAVNLRERFSCERMCAEILDFYGALGAR